MLSKFHTVYEGGEAEIIEKKSRFIATVLPVTCEEEALEFIESMKKKYWNATHNCYAYVIGERFETQRCSDDGEPQGTAGKPMLDVLLGEEIHNTAVVVTRYFGGTLLGTGGLVRAYSGAVKAGLEASKIITKNWGIKLEIQTDYTGLGKIQYILGQRGITVLDSVYAENVMLIALIPEEKKSRFIATVLPVTCEEEALEFIESMKKKYWNATHNCYAYVIGERFETQRCSDDGEPQGTAGKPMLDVLLGEEIHNTAVVVTRYFGGTLLGTGGLVRAYSGAVKAGLEASKIITKNWGIKLEIQTDYTGLGKIQYILGQRGITVLDSVYAENVMLIALIPEEMNQEVIAEITEGTNGQAKMTQKESCYFGTVDGEMKVFDTE